MRCNADCWCLAWDSCFCAYLLSVESEGFAFSIHLTSQEQFGDTLATAWIHSHVHKSAALLESQPNHDGCTFCIETGEEGPRQRHKPTPHEHLNMPTLDLLLMFQQTVRNEKITSIAK
jgi:hypothetical protein